MRRVILNIPDEFIGPVERWLDSPENTQFANNDKGEMVRQRIHATIDAAFDMAARAKLTDIAKRFPNPDNAAKLAMIKQLQQEIEQASVPPPLLAAETAPVGELA